MKMLNIKVKVKVKGFTLAEVLITLGIIGIVASMTIPTLVGNYRKHVMISKMKETVSIFNQVLQHAIIANGDTKTWDWNAFNPGNLNYDTAMQTYFLKYLNVIDKSCVYSNQARNEEQYNNPGNLQRKCYTTSMASDGSIIVGNNNAPKYILKNGVGFWVSYAGAENNITINLDLNLNKKPKFGEDFFTLLPQNTYSSRGFTGFNYTGGSRNSAVCTMIYENGTTSDGLTALEHCKKGVRHWSLGNMCGALIQCNNWEIPDNYPWQIR